MSGTPLTLPSNDVNYFSTYHDKTSRIQPNFLFLRGTANPDSSVPVEPAHYMVRGGTNVQELFEELKWLSMESRFLPHCVSAA